MKLLFLVTSPLGPVVRHSTCNFRSRVRNPVSQSVRGIFSRIPPSSQEYLPLNVGGKVQQYLLELLHKERAVRTKSWVQICINSSFWPIRINSCSLPKTRVYTNKQGCQIAKFLENLSRNWLLKIWTLQSGNPENNFFVPKWSLWLGNFTNSHKFAINILNSPKFASNIYNSLKFAHWNCQLVFGSCSLPKNQTLFVFAFFWFVPPLVLCTKFQYCSSRVTRLRTAKR